MTTPTQPKALERIGTGIRLTWQDGHVSEYSADYLRRLCPCAVCKEVPERKDGLLPSSILGNKPAAILSAQQIGWYALQFVFGDRHDTGIFSYELLREACVCEKCREQA